MGVDGEVGFRYSPQVGLALGSTLSAFAANSNNNGVNKDSEGHRIAWVTQMGSGLATGGAGGGAGTAAVVCGGVRATCPGLPASRFNPWKPWSRPREPRTGRGREPLASWRVLAPRGP